MSDQPKRSLWSRFPFTLTVLALLVLYVLSFGPVFWIASRLEVGLRDPVMQAVHAFYKPLIVIARNVEFVGDVYVWYRDLWSS